MLRYTFERIGFWLFRRRSFLAVAALPIAAIGLKSFTYIGRSHQTTELWQTGCFLISLSGLSVRAFTIGSVPTGTSGRNTRSQVASTLNTTGMYSLVRHPLYLGNYLAVLGSMTFFHRVWIVLVGSGVFAMLYMPIILFEEAFLRRSFGDAFERWAANTPAFIPRWNGWKPAALSFSWRTVLNREYTGLFVVSLVFFLFDLIGDWITEDRLQLDGWSLVLLVAGMLYLTLRSLKRRTRLLDVDGH